MIGSLRQLRCLICVLGLFGASASAASGAQSPSRYVAVIDAGSSGSRIYLYNVSRNERLKEASLLMEFESDAPGLSSFEATPADAGAKGLAPLLHRLTEFLLSKNIAKAEVRVDILATAGMRLLAEPAQKSIFDNVRKYVTETALSVGEVETISGAMEGVYSWIDVNYLLGRFQNMRRTLGVIEIGGASAQIAFETETPIPGSETVVIDDRKHIVFVKSFLGLGRNQARKRMIQASGIANNPCFPQGLFTDDQKAGATGVSGAFDYGACLKDYDGLIEKFGVQSIRDQLKKSPQSFAAVGAGSPVGTFWGLLEAWKIVSSDPFEIVAAAKANCVRRWSSFEAQYGGDAFNKSQCADSVFINSFLYAERGLNLKSGSVVSYKSIDGQTPTWTRGFVVSKYLK